MMTRTLLTMILGLTLAMPALADIYRWTDDNGQVHFGQNPPIGVDAERVDSRAQPAPSASEPNPETAETEEVDETEAAAPEEEDDEPARQETDATDALAEMCDGVRQNAEVYGDESVRRVRRGDGEVEILTPEDREQRLEEAQAFLDEHC